MDTNVLREFDDSQEWQILIDRLEDAVARHSRARMIAVAEAALAWSASKRPAPRGSTSNSRPDLAVYKEEPGGTTVWPHSRLDHYPHDHGTPECIALMDGGIPSEDADPNDA